MATRYWVGGAGTWSSTSTANWSATSGGAAGASAPTSVDDVIFDSLSGTGTCTTDATATARDTTLNTSTLGLTLSANLILVRSFALTLGVLNLNNQSLTCLNFVSNNTNTRSVAFGTGAISVTGNATTVWNMSNATNFTFTGTSTINLTYSGSTGTRAISFTTGTSEANALNFNVTAGTDTVTMPFASRNFDFTGFAGTLSLNASGSTLIYGNYTLSSGMTITGGGVALTFSATSGIQQITTAGNTINTPLSFNGIGGTFAFQDALTQGSTRGFSVINGTIQLKAGVTSTVGIFATSASNTNRKYLQSTLAGTQAILSQASGTINASYLTIKDINATGGATWNAFVDRSNIDAGNVDGWNFEISPVIGGAEYTYQIRSFTQSRRF